MKKSIGFILVALMVMGTMAFTSPALATEARVDALQAEYYIKDITNVFLNPALLALYPNTFIVEYGTSTSPSCDCSPSSDCCDSGSCSSGFDDDECCCQCVDHCVENRYVGATWQAMDNLTLGAYINRHTSALRHANSLGSMNFGSWDVSDPNNVDEFSVNSNLFADLKNPLDLLASWQLNSDTSIGLGIYLARGNAECELSSPIYGESGNWGSWDRSSSLYGITLGANINNQHEISFAYDTASVEASGEIEDDSDSQGKIKAEMDSYGLMYRGTFAASPTVSIVPTAYLGREKEEHSISVTNMSADERISSPEIKTDIIAVGCGARYETDKLLLVSALEIVNWKEEKETGSRIKGREEKETEMALYMGLEKRLSKCFLGRVGAKGLLYSKNEEQNFEAGTKTVTTDSVNNKEFLSIGVGYEHNNLAIDATIIDSLPFNGGYLLSGESGDLLGKISATYNFI